MARARGEGGAVRCAGAGHVVLRLRLAAAGADVELLLDLFHCVLGVEGFVDLFSVGEMDGSVVFKGWRGGGARYAQPATSMMSWW